MHNFRFRGLVVSHVEAVEVFSAHCISARMSKELDFVMHLTLSQQTLYIYHAPSKARNANVIYISH